MTAIQDYAARCKRKVEETARAINDLSDLRSNLERKRMEIGSEVTQRDIDAVDVDIAKHKNIFSEASRELRDAVTALAAENKLEEEMRNKAQELGL